MRQVETQTEKKYLLLDPLLFRIQNLHVEQNPILCIPESCVDNILVIYHNSLFGAHQGSVIEFVTIKQKELLPNLMHYIRSLLKICLICQLNKPGSTTQRQFKNRINQNYTNTNKLICDIKYKYSTDHSFILVVTDEVLNYLVTVLLYRGTSYKVGEALINDLFCKYGPRLFII